MFIYLLHFDQPVRNKSHYLGSCDSDQLNTRLRRHQAGTGSNLTKQAHQEQTGFTLAGLWNTENRDLERKFKVAKHYSQKCSVCLQQAQVASLFSDVLYFPPIAPIPPEVVHSWQIEPRRKIHPVKKGTR